MIQLKKIVSFLSILIILVGFIHPSTANADTPSTPSQCSGMTFDKVIVGTSKSETINGTSGRDLIFGNGGSDTIYGFGGDDCIVTSQNESSRVYAGDGNDKAYGNGAASLYGDSGNDNLSAPGSASIAFGGTDTDTCEAGYTVYCELLRNSN